MVIEMEVRVSGVFEGARLFGSGSPPLCPVQRQYALTVTCHLRRA